MLRGRRPASGRTRGSDAAPDRRQVPATTAISVGIALVIAWDAGEGLVKALRRR